jgi:hypothetical protein
MVIRHYAQFETESKGGNPSERTNITLYKSHLIIKDESNVQFVLNNFKKKNNNES